MFLERINPNLVDVDTCVAVRLLFSAFGRHDMELMDYTSEAPNDEKGFNERLVRYIKKWDEIHMRVASKRLLSLNAWDAWALGDSHFSVMREINTALHAFTKCYRHNLLDHSPRQGSEMANSACHILSEEHTLETALGRIKELLKIPNKKLGEMFKGAISYSAIMYSTSVFKWTKMVCQQLTTIPPSIIVDCQRKSWGL